MRKLTLALAIAVLALAGGFGTTVQKTNAAAYQAKVVIIVGATQGTTASYRSDADRTAADFAQYTSNIVKVYSPNATWANVKAAAKGANVLIYMGHGSGYPNPYIGYLQPNGDNGMGLNSSASGTDSNTKYYGENYMAQLELAPNAVVMLNHLCYASGDNEWGRGKPTLTVAKTRIDGYASGFIRGGAKAVIAEGLSDLSYYIDSLFTTNQTIDQIWRGMPWGHGNYSSWASSRNAGYTSAMDPDVQNPASDGDIYYRSMVSVPSTSSNSIVSGHVAPLVSKTGRYFALTPTRVVDTRTSSPGPLGALYSNGPYRFPIAGRGGVPGNAIAVTANLTVVSSSPGYVYLGPSVYGTPPSSTINFPGGDNRANGVTVALSPDGFVAAYFGGAADKTANVIIDVTGYFLQGSAGAGYVAFGPHRIEDTRAGTGQVGLLGKFVQGVPRQIKVAGVAGLPKSGMVAIAGNLTVVRPTHKGFVYLGPTNPGKSLPASSTINFPAGDIRANNVIVRVGSDGTLWADLWTDGTGNNVDLVLDVSGYFTASGGASFHTLDPARVLDTRTGVGGVTTSLAANRPITVQVTGHAGVPAGALAIAANLTGISTGTGGFAAMGPTVSASTPFSNLNLPSKDTRANGATTPLAARGSLQVVFGAAGGTVNVFLDACGYYGP